MFVAKQKRRENIAEYILYLWQLEDLLRALELSEGRIAQTLVEPYTDLDEQSRAQLLTWYVELANLLKIEGKTLTGHLEHTLHLVSDLNDLHLYLLGAPIGREYAARFAVVAPELPKLRGELSGGQTISDIELCFRALYSVVLCRLKGLEQSAYITDVLEVIAPVVGHLSAIYLSAERGEIDLYQKE